MRKTPNSADPDAQFDADAPTDPKTVSGDTTTKILVIGDHHGARPLFEELLEKVGDQKWHGVLLVGDLAPHTKTKSPPLELVEAERDYLLRSLEPLSAPVLWVPGNHDPRELDGPGNIDRRSAEIAGLSIYGIGGAGPASFGFPYEWTDEEIRDLDPSPHQILLSHCPPYGARDRVLWGRRVGSRALTELAPRFRVFVCGHIHEASGVQAFGDKTQGPQTLVLNAGSLGKPFPVLQHGEIHHHADDTFTIRYVSHIKGKVHELREERPL